MFGVLLIAVGSIDVVRQLAYGVPVPEVQWLLFLLVGGPGVGMFLLSPLLSHWSQLQSDVPVEDGDEDGGDAYLADDSGGDAGD